MCGIWLFLLKNSSDNVRESINLKDIFESFMKTSNRGPDRTTFDILNKPNNVILGFHRLSIMDPSTKGDQPFKLETESKTIWVICNGEIYNYKHLAEKYNLSLNSGSDCEVIIQLYNKIGMDEMCKELEGEYAFIVLDINMKTGKGDLFACRDRFGIRPMFYSENENYFNFSSELKSVTDLDNVKVFPPRSYMHLTNLESDSDLWKFVQFKNYYNLNLHKQTKITDFMSVENTGLDSIKEKIRETFIESVESKMMSDRPLGCLLSGGLDSSLVASIASRYLKKYGKTLKTFSIGMDGSTDEYYAKLVSKHIGSEHTHIEFSENDFVDAIGDVIYTIESYDITTVRASTGQYLISKWIKNNTDIKVLLIGDGSDELTAGYMYFHKAPSPEELHLENIKLLEDIHYYDVLRADRGVAENGIEARVPFLDYKFVDLYLSIDPNLRHPQSYKQYSESTVPLEKWLLRESFNLDNYLPDEVLFRKKEAFSDGVSSVEKSFYKIIQDYANELYTDGLFIEEYSRIEYNKPPTKEALYFRKIWEEYFGTNVNTSKVIPYFWLPQWCGNIKEPSARVLSVYSEQI